jgi:hypothetical protein
MRDSRRSGTPTTGPRSVDDVRREAWNQARRRGNVELARELKGARFAVSKNAENLADLCPQLPR